MPFLMKLVLSLWFARYARFSLAVKFYDLNLLNFLAAIYLSWSPSLVILFTAERAVLVAKLLNINSFGF